MGHFSQKHLMFLHIFDGFLVAKLATSQVSGGALVGGTGFDLRA
jgi:hypothetical protein